MALKHNDKSQIGAWIEPVARLIRHSSKRTRWLLIIALLIVIAFVTVVLTAPLLPSSVALVLIIAAIIVVVILAVFAFKAYKRSSRSDDGTSEKSVFRIVNVIEHEKHSTTIGEVSASNHMKQNDSLPPKKENRLAGKNGLPSQEARETDSKSIQMNGVKLTTAETFMNRLESAADAVFIDVQVTLGEWFNPWAQVHLAMQDSALHHIWLSTRDESSAASTPFRRVLITSQPWTHLEDRIRGKYYPEYNVVALTLIHCCMASPLAIITPETFVKSILRPNDSFFLDSRIEHLGLNDQTVEEMIKQTATAEKNLKSALRKMEMKPGVFKPSMDCAVLYFAEHSGVHPGSSIEVWKAALTRDGHIHYFTFDENGIENLLSKGINVPRKLISSSDNKKANGPLVQIASNCCVSLAKILDERVWEDRIDVNEFTSLEQAFSPIAKFLKERQGRQVPKFRHPKKEFDPFTLLSDAGIRL